MKLKTFVVGAGLVGAGAFAYGALVEAKRLVPEFRCLRLPRWPRAVSNYRVGLLADFHFRDRDSIEMAHRAIRWLSHLELDVIAIAGDIIPYWKPEAMALAREGLAPLATNPTPKIAVLGNHDHYGGVGADLKPMLADLDIQLLQNEVWTDGRVAFAGIDSLNARRHDVAGTLAQVPDGMPTVALWHEPDAVLALPLNQVSLMLSGHSHGGQFCAPWGWAPMKSTHGQIYVRGYYPHAPTPIYVSRGLATTGPPARLFCPAEVTMLLLQSTEP